MKEYPSIPNCGGQKFEGLGVVDVFDKLDGSNLRFEFSKKRGWYKFGSRTQMIDETSEQFGAAIPYIHQLGDDILPCFKRTPDKLVGFAEWWGPNSFAGVHAPNDEMRLTLFDIYVDNRGWMSPKDFLKTFGGRVDIPEYLGQHNWTRGFIQRVRDGELDVTFEGVIGKTLQGQRLKMGKAKTQAWIDKVHSLYDPELAQRLIDS